MFITSATPVNFSSFIPQYKVNIVWNNESFAVNNQFAVRVVSVGFQCSDRSSCHVPDARFLLRFLRTKKFSVLQAEEAVERYLLLRQTYGPAFRNLDYTDHTMNELISNGYVLRI